MTSPSDTIRNAAATLLARAGASPDPAELLRGWARCYREHPEHRFPSDPGAEFFPFDLEHAAKELDRLRALPAASSAAPESELKWQDEGDAAAAGHGRLVKIAKGLPPHPSNNITLLQVGNDSSMMLLWHNNTVVAAFATVRDAFNDTQLLQFTTSTAAPPAQAEAAGALWRHKKRGTTYRILHGEKYADCTASSATITQIDHEPFVVYQDVADGKVWVRPRSEFFDGRFEPVAPPSFENSDGGKTPADAKSGVTK